MIGPAVDQMAQSTLCKIANSQLKLDRAEIVENYRAAQTTKMERGKLNSAARLKNSALTVALFVRY
jgi:hypothetical protein